MNRKDRKKKVEYASITQEAYIEIIADLAQKQGRARVKEIADKIGVTMPSVSEVVRCLRRKGIVSGKPWHEIQLTVAGQRIADRLGRRHDALRKFMVEVMAMHEREADNIACRIEHHVDRNFSSRLLKLVRFLERQSPAVLKAFAKQASRPQVHAPGVAG